MSRRKTIPLFILCNIPLWILYVVWPQGLRLAIILLGFTAMWSLWVARRERKHLWTSKLRDIWLCLFLWCVAAVEANIELFYRHSRPSLAVLLVGGILILTIEAVFNKEKYTVNQP